MKPLKILAAAAVAVVILTTAVSAETINTIEQIEQTALLNNLEYKTAVLDVMKSENDLVSRLKLETSSVNLSGSYSDSNSDFGWQASILLPIFEQLSISASLNQEQTGIFGVNINPLAHSVTTAQTELAYSIKLAAAEEKAADIANTAVKSYLEWAAADSDYYIKLKTADVKKILYEDEKIRFDNGESNLDDVRDAFTSWSDARAGMNTALNQLQTAETGLYTTLNVDPADNNVESPVEADLFNLIDSLKAEIDASELSISGSYSVYIAETAAESLERQLKNTWLFEPDLGLSGSVRVVPGSTPELSASASLSIGLDDCKADERNELETELEISRQKAVQTMNSEQLQLQQALTRAETAAINYDVAEVELQQAEELLDEAEFLYELGDYSAAELEETGLLYQQIRNGLYSAAAEHYNALRALSVFAD
ncbi:MAG TPA: hypothetical protein DCO79_04020 [Spirochaeta sp.]|nr:hypothetical protein [Spirochaeta sp.]